MPIIGSYWPQIFINFCKKKRKKIEQQQLLDKLHVFTILCFGMYCNDFFLSRSLSLSLYLHILIQYWKSSLVFILYYLLLLLLSLSLNNLMPMAVMCVYFFQPPLFYFWSVSSIILLFFFLFCFVFIYKKLNLFHVFNHIVIVVFLLQLQLKWKW